MKRTLLYSGMVEKVVVTCDRCHAKLDLNAYYQIGILSHCVSKKDNPIVTNVENEGDYCSDCFEFLLNKINALLEQEKLK